MFTFTYVGSWEADSLSATAGTEEDDFSEVVVHRA